MNMDEIIKKFKFLDLTEYQSRVLYALLKNKSSSISQISKISGVPNTRVYDVVAQLISMEYVLQISDRPKTYRVRNVDMVLDSLVSKKEEDFEKVKSEFQDVKKFFKDDDPQEENKIIKVERDIDLISLINEEVLKAKKSVIGFGSEELANSSFKNTLKKISSDVDVRIISHPDFHAHVSDLNFIKPYPHGVSAYLIDNHKLVMKVNNDENVHHMSYTQGHDGMKNMIKTYFNSFWEK